MINVSAMPKLRRCNKNAGSEGGFSKFSIWFLGGAMLLVTFSLLGGCSSSPESAADPTREEVQTDSDRFFKHLEKEEAKKEPKEAKP
ncbi:MAG: hypothetical protein R3351_06255 [Nitrospirales bacterium]|nr:hypothetical protein [Nitrospirales bacterium]